MPQQMIMTLIELPAVNIIGTTVYIHDRDSGTNKAACKKTITINFSSGFSFINEFEYTTDKEDGVGVDVHKFCEVVMIGGASEYVALSKNELLERLGIQPISKEQIDAMTNREGIAIAQRAFTEAEMEKIKRRIIR